MENTNPDTSRCTRQGRLALIIILSVLIIDQIIKIVVKTNMHLGQMIDVTSWFKICFVENNGMAFGMEIIGKLFLSLFRIGAIGFFIWYLVKILNKGFPTGYIVTVSFVIAGAIGNLIDRIRFKYVVDYIYVKCINFPVFNVADIYVTCSIFALCIAILFCYSEEELSFLPFFGSKKPADAEPEQNDEE